MTSVVAVVALAGQSEDGDEVEEDDWMDLARARGDPVARAASVAADDAASRHKIVRREGERRRRARGGGDARGDARIDARWIRGVWYTREMRGRRTIGRSLGDVRVGCAVVLGRTSVAAAASRRT